MNFYTDHRSKKMTDNEVKEKIQEWVNLWDSEFAKEFNITPLRPTIEFNIRGRSTGGRAWRFENRIQFNLDWARYDFNVYAETTIPHELAHLYTYIIFNDSGHGRVWKKVMLSVGLNPDRTNGNFGGVEPARKVKKYLYSLPCGCEFELSSVRHNKIKRGIGYTCGKHKTTLKLTHWDGKIIA